MARNNSKPDEQISFTIDIALESPEFPNGVFMRSDLPNFLSIENNLLFPRDVKSLVKLTNNSNDNLSGANLKFQRGLLKTGVHLTQ